MPGANRYFLPNYVWHITHRCHKKEFLLKLARDRRRWCAWLFEVCIGPTPLPRYPTEPHNNYRQRSANSNIVPCKKLIN
jgi:hypothetical protein